MGWGMIYFNRIDTSSNLNDFISFLSMILCRRQIRAQHVISTRALVSVPRVRKSLAGYSLKNIIIFFKEPASDLCNSS